MNEQDYIYEQIYKGALKAGASDRAALQAATTGLQKYKNNQFKKASSLIIEKIKEAVKDKY